MADSSTHPLSLFFVIVLASCSKDETQPKPAAVAPTTAAMFTAQPALDRWVATLRAESPDCKIDVKTLVADEAEVSFEPMHPIATNAPPRQIPTVHELFVQPFAEDAVVAARRDDAQQRIDACVADAGPGPQHKGRDMNRESCSIAEGDVTIPNFHLDRELSVKLPPYFSPPNECTKAAAAIQARLTPYR